MQRPRMRTGPRQSRGVDAGRHPHAARARAADTRSLITCAWSLQRAHHGEQPYWAAIALGRDARRHRPAGRRLRLRPRLAQRRRRAARGLAGARGARLPLESGPQRRFRSRASPTCCSRPVALTSSTAVARSIPTSSLVYWAGGNPFHHHQDLNRLRAAWQKPDTIIVHDSWWTPTARHADIVLPATTSLERNDVGGSSRDPYVLGDAPRHRSARRGAKHDFEIFRDLAGRARLRGCLHRGPRRDGLVPLDLRTGAAERRQKNVDAAGLPDSFWADGFVELPPPDERFRAVRRFPPRSAASSAEDAVRKDRDRVADAVAGFDYADCPPHPAWLPPAEWLGSSTAERWPLHLVTHQPAGRLHSQTGSGIGLARPQGCTDASGSRMQSAGRRPSAASTTGDVVRVFNDRGGAASPARWSIAGVMPRRGDHGHRRLVRSGAGGRRARAARQP